MLKIDFTLMANRKRRFVPENRTIVCVIPALLTTMSGTPNTLVAVAAARATSSSRRHPPDGNRAGGDRRRPGGLIRPDVHRRHPRAFRGEPPGDPFAKPAACARDEAIFHGVVSRPSAVIDDERLRRGKAAP
jgi:hypothetical protein